MQDLNWEVVSAIRANRKKVQEHLHHKKLCLYIIAQYRSCGEACWRGRRALKDDHGDASVATAPRQRHAPHPPPLFICIYAASPPNAMSTPNVREAALANDQRQAVNARWRRIVGSESHAPGRRYSARNAAHIKTGPQQARDLSPPVLCAGRH